MSERTETIQQLYDQTQGLVKTQLSIYKLKAVAKTANVSASIASIVLLGLIGVMFLLFISLGLAFLMAEWVENTAAGFGIVAGIYLVAGLIIYAIRNTTLRRFVSDRVVNEILNDDDDKDEKNQ